jgi:phage N-6-adenine-methyltransferase
MIDDEWETPDNLYALCCNIAGFVPDTDVCATDDNSKCIGYVDKEMDCLKHDFKYHDEGLWCNPPHSMTKQFVLKMHEQWLKHNIPILMIVPANSICTKYFESIYNDVEIYPIFGRPKFLKDGKPSKYPSRNSYFVVIWRKKTHKKTGLNPKGKT